MTNNPKPPKDDKLLDILEWIAEPHFTDKRFARAADAKAQINNYIKEQMLSLIGEYDKVGDKVEDSIIPMQFTEVGYRNMLRKELIAAINERFK